MTSTVPLTPQEKAKDRRLWKCYRWTLARYNALGELQGWRCYGCGKHRDEKGLNLDHYHFKIKLTRLDEGEVSGYKWVATTEIPGQIFSFRGYGKTQKEAREQLKRQALPASVRGLLCRGRHGLGCNTKLGRIDDVKWLAKMIEYLNDPPAKRLK